MFKFWPFSSSSSSAVAADDTAAAAARRWTVSLEQSLSQAESEAEAEEAAEAEAASLPLHMQLPVALRTLSHWEISPSGSKLARITVICGSNVNQVRSTRKSVLRALQNIPVISTMNGGGDLEDVLESINQRHQDYDAEEEPALVVINNFGGAISSQLLEILQELESMNLYVLISTRGWDYLPVPIRPLVSRVIFHRHGPASSRSFLRDSRVTIPTRMWSLLMHQHIRGPQALICNFGGGEEDDDDNEPPMRLAQWTRNDSTLDTMYDLRVNEFIDALQSSSILLCDVNSSFFNEFAWRREIRKRLNGVEWIGLYQHWDSFDNDDLANREAIIEEAGDAINEELGALFSGIREDLKPRYREDRNFNLEELCESFVSDLLENTWFPIPTAPVLTLKSKQD